MKHWALTWERKHRRYSTRKKRFFWSKEKAKEAGEKLFANKNLEWKGEEREQLQIGGSEVFVEPEKVHDEVPEEIERRHERQIENSPINYEE